MSYEVTIEPTGEVVEVEEDQTLLDACLRQGVWLPFACGHGTCGTCKVQVVEGECDLGEASSFALMDMERDEGMVLACCAVPESDMVIEADIDVDPDFMAFKVDDFRGTVIAIEDLSPTIKQLTISLNKNLSFQAGQYINLKLPGIEGSRAFSIANSPAGHPIENKQVILHARRVPDGKATSFIHEQLETGCELELSGPYGQFFVRKSAPGDLIFIAGGSGLSSPQSMILDLLAVSDPRRITLFHGARNLDELYNRHLFEDLARKHARFNYVPALDSPAVSDQWQGCTGYVHEAAIETFNGNFEGLKAYLCGPPPMIDAAISALMKGRLFERDIFMERFLTAADASSPRSALFKKI